MLCYNIPTYSNKPPRGRALLLVARCRSYRLSARWVRCSPALDVRLRARDRTPRPSAPKVLPTLEVAPPRRRMVTGRVSRGGAHWISTFIILEESQSRTRPRAGRAAAPGRAPHPAPPPTLFPPREISRGEQDLVRTSRDTGEREWGAQCCARASHSKFLC